MRRIMNAWDQAVLMRCPVAWQLRLHWYLPVALLWCALVLGAWVGWMATPARWMGTDPGVAVARSWSTPEQSTLQVSAAIAWIIGLGLGLWWLLRVRIHNRWRERAPAPRLGVFWEYLGGAAFFSLLFAPALALDAAYAHRVRGLWQGQDVPAHIAAARHVDNLEMLLEPRNAARLVEWTAALADDKADAGRSESAPPLQSLRWLARGDAAAIGQALARYGEALHAWGYAPAEADAPPQQARRLLAAYEAALQSPLAQEWRAYKARHPAPAGQERDARTAPRGCLENDAWHPDSMDHDNARACFGSYLSLTSEQWLRMLAHPGRNHSTSAPRIVPWSHPRYGAALPRLMQAHLQHADASSGALWSQRGDLLFTVSFGFFAALALIAARLMSPLQMAAWGAGLVLAFPCLMLLSMLGQAMDRMQWLIPAVLLTIAGLRIMWLRKPWAGSLLLGLAMVLGLVEITTLWSAWAHEFNRSGTDLQRTDAQLWLQALMQAPAMAASTAALAAILSPLWRRWRGLPER